MIVTFSGSLQAQQALPQDPAGPSFDVEIKAPQEIQTYLQSHLELLRYRELNDLDASELERLMEAAERNTRDLLGTLGYFSPDIGLPSPPLPARHPRWYRFLWCRANPPGLVQSTWSSRVRWEQIRQPSRSEMPFAPAGLCARA